MYLKFFKFIPVIFLFAAFLIPQEAFAQSDMEQIIKQIEQGSYTPTSVSEKEMISEYLDKIQKQNNVTIEKMLSPDATTFFEENFSPPIVWKDNFDYSGLLTDNGWSAHSGAGTNAIETTTGLTYTGYPGSGVGNAAQLDNTGEDVNQPFTAQTTGDVYMSALINVTSGPSGYFMHIAPYGTFNYVARLWVKPSTTAGKINFGISNSSTAVYATTPTDYDDSTTYLAIIKYTIGTPDNVSLWIVSSGIPADEVAAGTPEVTDSQAGQSEISGVYLRQYSSSQDITVDGIRIGTSWDEILFPVQGLPAGWTNVDNGTTGQIWEFDNPGARTITGDFDADFAILDSDNYGSGGSQDATLTTPAINCAAATNVVLGFDQQFRPLDYGILEISNDGTTWTQLDSVTSAGYPNPPVYTEYDITAQAAGQSTVYIRWTYVGSWGYWWAIDNVIVYEPDAFPLPAVLVSPPDAGTNISPYTSLNWIAGGGAAPTGYIINFGTDNPPTNIENGTDLSLVTSYTPTSALAPNTVHYWEIIPYNDDGNATGTTVWSFTTGPDPTVTLPYTEGFDGVTAPAVPYGWTVENSNADAYEWITSTSYDRSVPNAMYMRWNTSLAMDDWLISPPVQLTGGTEYRVKFWFYGSSSFDEKLEIKWGTSPTSSGMTEGPIFDSTFAIASYSEGVALFTPSTSGTYFIGWHGYSDPNQLSIKLDDVTIEVAPTVPIFSVDPDSVDFGELQINTSSPDQAFTITNVGAGTLTINSGGISIVGTDATQFALTDTNSYPINLGANESAFVDVNFSPTSVGGKLASLQIVDNTAEATQTVPLVGTGVDATITSFPWTDDLETPGAPGTPAGWTQDTGDDFDWTFDAGGTPSTGTGPTIDHNPGTAAGTYGFTESSTNNGLTANVWTPPLDLTGLTNPTLSFWYHMYGATMGTLNVDYSTDNGTTWTNGWTLSGDQGDAWFNGELVLPTTTNLVRFSGTNGSSFTSDMAFDDINLYDNTSPPNCAVNVSPPDGEDSVNVFTNLNWAGGGGGPTGYLIYFGTDNPPTNIENGTDLGNVLTYTPSTTLTSGTTYYWQIVPYNVNGPATGCAVWSFDTYPDAPLSGVYTVGLNDFMQKTGKKVYFEERTRTVTKDINGVDAVEDINAVDGETKTEITNPELSPVYVEVTETYMELMENGKPFDRRFYQESTDGVYPTLTEAINDLKLRGVSGPVTFSLVDTRYDNETYPILIEEYGGASSTNTVTIKPASGIQAEIPGDPAQPTSTLQLGSADYVTIDGSNNGTTSKDLKIVGLASGTIPAIHLYGDASNNVIKNLVLESQNTSTGSGIVLFGAGPFDCDNNLIENCTIKPIDTIATRPGVGVYFFSSATGDGNQIVGCDIYDFDDYGLRLQGAPTSNTLVSECDVYMTDDVSTSTTYGVYVSRVEGLIVEKSKFRDLNGGTTIKGAYVAGSSLSGDFIFRNNFFSPAVATNSTSAYVGLDYFGYAANSLEAYHNSILISGAATSGTTYGLAKRDDANNYIAYNNSVYNARTGGTGSHYAIYISDTNTVALDLDYNNYFADGAGGVLGFYQGVGDIADLTTWQSSTGLDANSVSGDPGYTSINDLHVQSGFNTLDGNALYFASVPDDIDGEARNMTTPDIGADEYTYIPPSVLDPTNVTATAISQSQIDVGFTPNGNNDNVVIVFNLDGVFTAPTGTPPAPGNPFAGGTLIANTTTSPYSHTGLTNLTTYFYKLWSYDGANYSNGVAANATTPFGTISTFPYVQNFDNGGVIPDGWNQDPGNAENWLFGQSATYAAGSDHTSGSGYFAWVDDSTPANAYPAGLNSPIFDVTGLTEPTASFWYWIGVNNPSAGPSYLNVDVSTDGGTTWTDSVVTAMVENGQWDEMTIDLTAYSSSSLVLRFNAFEDLASFYCDLSVDDFTLYDGTAPPNCPIATSPTDGETGVSITTNLVWASGGGGPDGYILYFGTDGGGTTPPTNLVNGDTIYTTTYDPPADLNFSTTYYWQVIAFNANGQSTGCDIWDFTTGSPAAIPYSQTFDGADFPPYWSQTSTISDRWTVVTTTNAGGSPNELREGYASGTGVSRLILGPINTTGYSNLLLEFKHFFNDYGAGITFKIQTSADASTWTDEVYNFVSGGGDIGPETVQTPISNNLGITTTYVAWVSDGNHFQFDYYYIDDVNLTEPPANDVGTFSIDFAEVAPGSVTPLATVKNFGIAAQTFDVQMDIDTYSSTKTVTGLAPGATEQVTFDNWNATEGLYPVAVKTLLVGDENPSNDSLASDVIVATGTWASGTSNAIQYFGGGVGVNGFLYSIAGNGASAAISDCYKYEVATDTWTTIASLPIAIRAFAIASDGTSIFVMGGSDNASVYQTAVYKYDIVGDTWTTVAALPLGIGFGKAAVYNGYVYFVGGYDGTNYLNTVYVYDISANTWTTATTTMPTGTFAGAMSIVDNKLVYVGGATALGITSDVMVGEISMADPFTITWTTMATPYPGVNKQLYAEYEGNLAELMLGEDDNKVKTHLPQAESYPAGVMFRFDAAPWGTDEIIVAGGDNTVTFAPAIPNRCYSYNPTTDTWTIKFDVASPVCTQQMGTVNSGDTWKLVISGGVGLAGLIDVTQIFTDELGGGTTFPLSVTISDGWNMVSVPGTNPAGMGVSDWWSGLTGQVFEFVPGAGYNAITTTTPTEGYWMKHVGATVYNYPAIGIVAHNPIPAAQGWNMLGGYEDVTDVNTITTNPTGQLILPIYEYVPGAGYGTAANLVPGTGYWVKTASACDVIIPDVILAKGGGEEVEYFKEEWGRIMMTDAEGKTYTLYAVNGEVDLDRYELPPLPPQGMFDIRYGSGRIADDINSSVQTIEMRGIVHPVTLRAENMDIRVQDETGKKINVNVKDGEDIVISDAQISKLMVSGELLPTVYALQQNYPNPFNPSTTIEFSLPEEVKNVKLSIYSILGEKVAELVNTSLVAGNYKFQWNAQNVATGMYIYELRTDKFVSVKKMMLLK